MTEKIIFSMSELAEFVGVSRQRMYQMRDSLPDPDVPTVNGDPAWKASTITKWNKSRPKTGRPRK